MKILIRFKGDNDFGNVLRPFATMLIYRGDYDERCHTKENIKRWFNTMSFCIYEICQHNYREQPDKNTGEYLQIKEEDIFIGEEVDKKLESYSQWGNYDSVLIDFGNSYTRPLVSVI
jgi:hypothetical protein